VARFRGIAGKAVECSGVGFARPSATELSGKYPAVRSVEPV
jgi:hypothetical protein